MPVAIAYDSAVLSIPAAVAGVYRLAVGKDQVFVLQAGQKLFGAGAGAGALVSVAISAAIEKGFGA